jgi:hypothetical protein
MASLKRLLVGSPIRTARLAHERLTKKTALGDLRVGRTIFNRLRN